MKKTKLFIEAVPLVDRQMSGIPHALAGLVAALAANKQVSQQFEIVLVAPKNRLHLLDRWQGLETCTRKAIPMKFRVMNGLGRRGLLPPMDLLLGKGVYLFGNFFNWPLTKQSRSLTYIHDICFALYPELVQPDNQKMLAKNVPRYIRQTDHIIAVSETSRREIVRTFGVPAKKVIVVYNAVNPLYAKAFTQKEVEQSQAKYGLDGKKYFVFIGNIEPRKNLVRCLEALEKLPKEVSLIMIGSDGWLNDEVFRRIDAANKGGRLVVKPKHYVDDEAAAQLLQGSLGLAMPSIYEGFGMPALEALTAGKPAVLADIPQLREVAGEIAFYCNPQSVSSIVVALKKVTTLTSAQRRDFAKKAKTQAAQFSWEQSAQTVAKTLAQLQ